MSFSLLHLYDPKFFPDCAITNALYREGPIDSLLRTRKDVAPMRRYGGSKNKRKGSELPLGSFHGTSDGRGPSLKVMTFPNLMVVLPRARM